MQLNLSFEPFRAYSTAAASGGGATSSSGGGSTVTSGSEEATIWTSDVIEDEGSGDFLLTNIVDGHYHTIRPHTHEVENDPHTHSVAVPSHTHTVPAHTHGLTFGIYEGTTADSATVKVDGTTVTGIVDYSDINIVAYLNTDGGGKITRNTWHEVTITPNRLLALP